MIISHGERTFNVRPVRDRASLTVTRTPRHFQVGFLGYFTGCVDHNNMPIVSGDSKDEVGGWRSLFAGGNKTVRARVLIVDYPNKVFIRY